MYITYSIVQHIIIYYNVLYTITGCRRRPGAKRHVRCLIHDVIYVLVNVLVVCLMR